MVTRNGVPVANNATVVLAENTTVTTFTVTHQTGLATTVPLTVIGVPRPGWPTFPVGGEAPSQLLIVLPGLGPIGCRVSVRCPPGPVGR